MRYEGGFRVGPDEEPDRYVLGAAVASGAEGVLYSAVLRTADGAGLEVAIKVLHPVHLPLLREWHARWREQVELLRSLHCPGVVRVRDGFLGPLPHAVGEIIETRTLYLVMDWVDGEPLDEWVRRRPDRDPFDTFKLLVPVAGALDLMHSGQRTGGVPVAHRDIKPSNIVVTDEGGVLIDFGLIRGLPSGSRLSGVTGTRGYMGPEITEAGVYSPASDRYALGAVAYFVFTGEEPPTTHQAGSLRAALARVPALGNRPEAVDHLMAMLADDPDGRPVALANWVGQVRASSLPSLPDTLRPEALRRHADIMNSSSADQNHGDGDSHITPVGAQRQELDGRAMTGGDGGGAAAMKSDRTASGARRLWAILGGIAALLGLVLAIVLLRPGDGPGSTTAGTGSTLGGSTPESTTVPLRTAGTIPPTILAPIADTSVNQGAPTRNFGPGVPDFTSELFSRGTSGLATYMRFLFPAAPPGKKLTEAALTIWTTAGPTAGSADLHDVRVASDSWVETEITWINRPQLATAVTVGVINAPQVDTAYVIQLDVTAMQAFVDVPGPRTLAVTSGNPAGSDNLNFWGSRYEREDHRVKLTLTFS